MDEETQAAYREKQRAREPMMLSALRRLPEDELISRYDALTMPASPTKGARYLEADDFLREIDRRKVERSSIAIERLTWAIAVLTAVLVAFTIVMFVTD